MFFSQPGVPEPRSRRNKGFTLIEIFAAIVILAILASLSVNVMRDYKIRQNVEAARQQFVNSVTAAMTAAAKYNTSYQVIWDGTSKTIKACVLRSAATGAPTCIDDDIEFSFSTQSLSKAFVFWGGQSSDAGSNVRMLTVTPYGKITLNSPAGSTTSRIYFADEERNVLTKQKLCIGINIGRNGTVERLESETSASSSCPGA
ncbi:MAG: Tfp pilus assembly protein FimT/FimU [Succinivibrionaceae bacterium]